MAENNLAFHMLLAGDLPGATKHIGGAVELTERYALSFLWQYVHSTAGEIALSRGELDTTDAVLGQAFEAARAWDNPVQMANVRVNQALVARARDDRARAAVLIAEARELLGDAIDPFVRANLARAGAELL